MSRHDPIPGRAGLPLFLAPHPAFAPPPATATPPVDEEAAARLNALLDTATATGFRASPNRGLRLHERLARWRIRRTAP